MKGYQSQKPEYAKADALFSDQGHPIVSHNTLDSKTKPEPGKDKTNGLEAAANEVSICPKTGEQLRFGPREDYGNGDRVNNLHGYVHYTD